MGKELGNGWTVEKEWTTEDGFEMPKSPDYYNRPYFCGYVKVTRDMHLYESKERYPDLEVYGGITFFGPFYKKEEEEGIKWIGFDCNHYWDIEDPKDIRFVERECESISQQIKQYEAGEAVYRE